MRLWAAKGMNVVNQPSCLQSLIQRRAMHRKFTSIYKYVCKYRFFSLKCLIAEFRFLYLFIGLVGRGFTNGLVDWGSIPGRVIPKTQKMVLDASLINTQHYTVWIKGKWNSPGNGAASSPTPWCSNYWKREVSGHPWLQSPTLLLLFI